MRLGAVCPEQRPYLGEDEDGDSLVVSQPAVALIRSYQRMERGSSGGGGRHRKSFLKSPEGGDCLSYVGQSRGLRRPE